jgi:hypothetical protein
LAAPAWPHCGAVLGFPFGSSSERGIQSHHGTKATPGRARLRTGCSTSPWLYAAFR